MSAGDRWELPGGHVGIETEGSTRGLLRLMLIREGWPFPVGIREVARCLCTRMPSRYLQGAIPAEAGEKDEAWRAKW